MNMTLKDTSQPEIVAARIVAVSGKTVKVVTEDGQTLRIPLPSNYRQDQTMLASLKDIWRAGIWIPVNRQLKRLFHYDWLSEPAPVPATNH
ncbi:hypothetical protein HMPREF0494_0623 [Limosilactobacillus antri DSM 16041]|uniref:Uncharacterized protein n=2 Tax=Limosilactobacillus antri TaxID=227943 RepID=C8P5N1_9LACO|nr:hypothetical protein HMPREF0494_0623 [Limosilactobacillus antri DSM 16041]KRK60012.1 hypothetical protein FC31_GL002092 [Limosilactobacillus antri DSM 16041]